MRTTFYVMAMAVAVVAGLVLLADIAYGATVEIPIDTRYRGAVGGGEAAWASAALLSAGARWRGFTSRRRPRPPAR